MHTRLLPRLRPNFGLWLSLLLMMYLPACASFNELTGPTAVPGVVASVEVTAPQPLLGVGASLPLQALVRDANGNPVAERNVMWSTSDVKIATVSAEGVVTGVGVGTVKISASVQGRSGTASLSITARPVASILVNPPSPNLLVGGQLQLSSTTVGESGDVLQGRSVFWSTSNPLVASIDNTGLLTGLAPGTTTITATSENRNASVGVTVLPVPVATVQISPTLDTVVVGQTTQLSAVARDSVGTPLADRAIAWTSGTPGSATVSASGLVVGIAAGTVTITASSEGKSGTSRVVVLPRPVGSVIVSPAQIAINAGQTVKLTVQITDNSGTLLTGRPIAYSSGNTSIATVANDGTVTGVNVGSTNITVTSEGKTGVANVSVSASPIATIRITLPAPELAIGATQKVTATLLDANGNVLPARPITWTSGAPTVASITADGTVTALAAGTAVLFATVEGKLASAPLVVRAITVVTVAVAPPTASIYVGDGLDLGAQARDASGAVIAGKAVEWTSSDERIAVVSSAGRVRALAVGQVLITAKVDGISGSSAITTQLEPVLTVTVDPPSLNLQPTTSGTLVATTRGRNGAVLTGRAVTFTSADPSIATVTQAGVVNALRTGATTITVASEGKQVSVAVTVAQATVATVTASLASASLQVGGTTQASAITRDAANNVLTGRVVTWSSSDASIATVNATTGVVTAIGGGTAVITATSEGKTGTVSLTVTAIPVATVNVTLANPSRIIGQTTQASAATLDAAGGTLANRPVVWASSNTQIATVSQTGLVTAVTQGAVQITATSEGKTGTATFTVLPVPVAKVNVSLANGSRYTGQTTTASVTTLDAAGLTLTGRAVVWSSSDPQVASVTQAGVVTAVGVGSANIIAISEGVTGSAPFSVTPPPVASVTVTLANVKPYVTQTSQATVVLKDPNGNVLTGRQVTWSSSDPSVASVSATGLVTALSPNVGPTTIIATSEGVQGSAPITVALVPVSSVVVTIAKPGLLIGQGTTAAAVTLDSVQGVLTGRTITWSSSNPLVAQVSQTGVITTLLPGKTDITATSEGVAGSAPLTVSLIPVASISVSIDKPQLLVLQTAQMTAVTRDAANNILPGRVTTWTSSNSGIATVSTTGVVTGIAAGTATITGTSEGVSASAQVAVSIAPVAFVSVAVNSTSLLVGQTTQANAITSDAANNVVTGRAVAFSSSNSAVATVDQAGVITAVGRGSANIIATSEGKTGFVTINVSTVPVNSISVSLSGNRSNFFVGETNQASAITRDAGGAVLTGRLVVWTSSNTAVATVNSSGLITMVAAGTSVITAQSEGKSSQVTVNVTNAPVASLTVSLNASTLTPLRTTQANVVVRDAAGRQLTGRVVTFTSGNFLVASVSPTGLVTALLPGTTTITAVSEGISGSATLTVTLSPVASVTAKLVPTSVVAGQTAQASAVTVDNNGDVVTGRAVAWSSANPSVATVDGNGLVTSVAPGTANITATSEQQSGSATLTVTAPVPVPVASVSVALNPSSVVAGGTSQATATTRDASNGVLSGRVVTWQSSNTSVATVNANGLVSTLTAGSTNITATSEGQSANATLTVTAPPPAPVASVSVALNPASVVAGATSQGTATTRDASNAVLTGRVVTWQSSNTAVATVDGNGLITTLTAGTTDITATSEGKSAFATLTVTPPAPAPVASVSVALNPASVVAGATSQATATTRDASNAVLTGRVVTWQSSNTAVATVDGNGLITTLTTGTTDITATSEGKSAFATLTVTAPAPAPVATVSVALNPASVVAGATSQATATTRDASNAVLTGRVVTWQSSNTAVATVDGNGLITTLTAGTTDITATSEGKSAFATLTVTAPAPAPVASVSVALNPASVVAGATSQATATTRDASNAVLTGRVVTWQSSNTAVATVDGNGLITTLTAGTTDITATSEGKSAFATLTVTAPAPAPVASVSVALNPASVVAGATSQATATTRDASNAVLTGRVVTWQSSNTAVATVDGNGLVTTLTAGTTDITATSEGKSAFATLTVTAPAPAPVASVSVALNPASVVAGATSQATATTRDASNAVLNGRVVTWQSSNTAVATVDGNGLVTTLTAGTTDITATSEGRSALATLTVTAPPPAPVATVSVALNPASVVAGATSQATATTRDASNAVLTGRVVTWQSSNTAVATVDGNGLITSLTAGTTDITATSEGKSAFATLTVTAPLPAPVATVSVALNPASVVAGGTSQATATTRDASNAVLNGRVVTWQSSNTAVATVDGNGLITTLSAGTTNITATSEGKSAFATLTVTAPAPAPVASVSVALNPASVVAGGTSQATATTRDASNAVVTGRVVTWQSSNTAVATVDGNGLITTLTAGTTDITATSEGKSAFATLNVTAVPGQVTTVDVSLTPASVAVGQTAQANAVARDANGTAVPVNNIAWDTSDPTIATINANGLITARNAGTVDVTAKARGRTGTATLTVTVMPAENANVSWAAAAFLPDGPQR